MEYNKNDIVIRLKIEGNKGGTDTKHILQAFESLEIALYESDRQDIEDLFSQRLISRIVADASLERLRRYRHNRLLLRNAENGSIILEGVVAATTLFILENTLGEAVKDAIKESEPYQKIKEWFKERINSKASFISNALQKELYAKKRRFDIRQMDEGKKLELTFKESKESRENIQIPSLGDELKGN